MHVGLRSNCAPSLRKINFLNLRANAKKLHGPALKYFDAQNLEFPHIFFSNLRPTEATFVLEICNEEFIRVVLINCD